MTAYDPPLPGLAEDVPDAAAPALLARLAVLRDGVAALVARRAAGDPTAEDPLRGLYVSDEAARQLLDRWRPEEDAEGSEESGAPAPGAVAAGAHPDGAPGDRLARLALRAGLTGLDTALLLIALAPDVDRGVEPLYGYLNDDVSRRRATAGLALELCGVPTSQAAARARLHASAPLRAWGLLEVEEPERPFLTRSLRVPDRVAGHLLGDDTPDAALLGLLQPLPPPLPQDPEATEFTRLLAARLGAGPVTAYLREPREGDGLAVLAAALPAAGLSALTCMAAEERVPELLREARLTGRPLVVPGLPERPGPLVRALTAAPDVTVLLTDRRPYDPEWSPADVLVLDAPGRRAGGTAAWRAALGADADGFDLAAAVA
ncbi:ATP-binding protein, partial [Streptomyces albidoflavus]